MPLPNWSDKAHDYVCRNFPRASAATVSEVTCAYLNGALDAMQFCNADLALQLRRPEAPALPAPAVDAADSAPLAFGRAARELLDSGRKPAPLKSLPLKDGGETW